MCGWEHAVPGILSRHSVFSVLCTIQKRRSHRNPVTDMLRTIESGIKLPAVLFSLLAVLTVNGSSKDAVTAFDSLD